MAVAKGTEQLNTGIDAQIKQDLVTFCEQRGEKIRAVVEAALVRHMANPPPLPGQVPLSPAPPSSPARARKAKG